MKIVIFRFPFLLTIHGFAASVQAKNIVLLSTKYLIPGSQIFMQQYAIS